MYAGKEDKQIFCLCFFCFVLYDKERKMEILHETVVKCGKLVLLGAGVIWRLILPRYKRIFEGHILIFEGI